MIQPAPIEPNWTLLADAAFERASQDAIDVARRFDTPVLVVEHGQTLRLTPDEAQSRLAATRQPGHRHNPS